jgi:hypothetical protein
MNEKKFQEMSLGRAPAFCARGRNIFRHANTIKFDSAGTTCRKDQGEISQSIEINKGGMKQFREIRR